MNKVICDICGTAYPDTSPKCPICGYAKVSSEPTSVGSERTTNDGGYSAVKGGRFSKQNVRKRTGSGKMPERSSNTERSRRSQNEEGNTGLILVVIFLLVAIVAVVIYIGLRVFRTPDAAPNPTPSTQVTQPATTPSDPTDATTGVACESLQLSNQTIEFINLGDNWTLVARPTPSNTTDAVTFESSDPNVVIVDEAGYLTAVGSGEATITVTCGTVTETCVIKCSFTMPSVPPTEPGEVTTDPSTGETVNPTTPTEQVATNPTAPTTQPTVPAGTVDPNFTFAFRYASYDDASGKWDTTISADQTTWTAYKNDLSVDPSQITWTSDDTSVCTVENGIVTKVGAGKTEIHATYGGKTYTCIVRCKVAEGTTGGNTNNGGNTGNTDTTTGSYKISSDDMTIALGEFWYLYLKDDAGNKLDVTWKAEDGSIVSIDGNKIYGEKVGKTTVTTTYEGVTYSCIVRIKAAN